MAIEVCEGCIFCKRSIRFDGNESKNLISVEVLSR